MCSIVILLTPVLDTARSRLRIRIEILQVDTEAKTALAAIERQIKAIFTLISAELLRAGFQPAQRFGPIPVKVREGALDGAGACPGD
jgi:hypothetical protein